MEWEVVVVVVVVVLTTRWTTFLKEKAPYYENEKKI